MVSAVVPVLRAATVEDLDAIAEVMRVSVLDLFPAFYDERQTTSAAVHIAHVDPMLIVDGTYFVFVAEGETVACGGWSRRGRLYTGDGDLRIQRDRTVLADDARRREDRGRPDGASDRLSVRRNVCRPVRSLKQQRSPMRVDLLPAISDSVVPIPADCALTSIRPVAHRYRSRGRSRCRAAPGRSPPMYSPSNVQNRPSFIAALVYVADQPVLGPEPRGVAGVGVAVNAQSFQVMILSVAERPERSTTVIKPVVGCEAVVLTHSIEPTVSRLQGIGLPVHSG